MYNFRISYNSYNTHLFIIRFMRTEPFVHDTICIAYRAILTTMVLSLNSIFYFQSQNSIFLIFTICTPSYSICDRGVQKTCQPAKPDPTHPYFNICLKYIIYLIIFFKKTSCRALLRFLLSYII